ncbi:XkdX family protein [Inediibacterium massiliense]|nr:XkdX family protein [Inediibacterium massiliense]
MFETIRDAYKCGFYTLDNVKLMCEVSFISKEEYKTITGEDYIV